jgi:hypothetical protein
MCSRDPDGLHAYGGHGRAEQAWRGPRGDRSVAAMAAAAARLLRTYAIQVETLRRLRNGSSQFVRVEHVHVNEGGQAVIGPVSVKPGTEVQSREPPGRRAPAVGLVSVT